MRGSTWFARRTAVLLAVSIGASGLIGAAGSGANGFPGPPPRTIRVPKPLLESFRGLGTWVDIYDTHQYEHPWRTVRGAKRKGVRTLYLETSNDRSPKGIMMPRRVSYFIHAAHKYGLDIIAWYLPGFENLEKDHRRTMRAIRFKTPRGQTFDGFAMDIEADTVQPISLRQERMLQLSKRVRASVGETYPLGAIIPSPYDLQDPSSYWGNDFPYRRVANHYDVILPMSYSSFRAEGLEATHHYIAKSISIIRNETGDRKIPIHAIGGIGDGSSRDEVRGFVRAVRESGILGGSFYDYGMTARDAWPELIKIPTNPPQAPALPVRIDYVAPLGNVPGADETHPKEVFFSTKGRAGAARLSFEPFDAQNGEITVWVNWNQIGRVGETTPAVWGGRQRIRIPAKHLHDRKRNLIFFVADGHYPDWRKWGVRNVRLERIG